MTVNELIEELSYLSGNELVVVPSFDHTYREVSSTHDCLADCHLDFLSEFDHANGISARGEIVNVVVIR